MKKIKEYLKGLGKEIQYTFNDMPLDEKRKLIVNITAVIVALISVFVFTICVKVCPILILVMFMFMCIELLVMLVLVIIYDVLE